MRLTITDQFGNSDLGELRVTKDEVQSVQQSYEKSIVRLKNGSAYMIKGIYKTLDDLFRYGQ